MRYDDFCIKCGDVIDPVGELLCNECLYIYRPAPKPAEPIVVNGDAGQVVRVRHITIKKFVQESGYTEDAVYSKIYRGDWLEGEVWIKAPDGRDLIDTEGFKEWVLKENQS